MMPFCIPKSKDLHVISKFVSKDHTLEKSWYKGLANFFVFCYIKFCHCERTWLSGRASPCQGEGREFESRRPLHSRDVAQLGRAPGLGPGGRMFKSCRPDLEFRSEMLEVRWV